MSDYVAPCDRCGAVTPDALSVVVAIVSIVSMQKPTRSAYLCRACDVDLAEWINSPPPRREASD